MARALFGSLEIIVISANNYLRSSAMFRVFWVSCLVLSGSGFGIGLFYPP